LARWSLTIQITFAADPVRGHLLTMSSSLT
jgi:hypothetical protein